MARTVDELVEHARRLLAQAPFGPPGREAVLILGHLLGWSEAEVLARGDRPVPVAEEQRFEALIARRLEGEPVAYLLGRREFYGRSFRVDARVLVPRPETEHLVEAALALPLPPRPRILDVGTGSGCLAVTLALEIGEARVVATDVSLGALAVASANARRLEAAVRFVGTDLAAGIDGSAFDLIVSNPPYIPEEDAAALSPEVRDFEPHLALFAEEDGQAVIGRLLELGRTLQAGAHMALEIGYGQLEKVLQRVASAPLGVLEIRDDLAGIPRVLVLRRAG